VDRRGDRGRIDRHCQDAADHHGDTEELNRLQGLTEQHDTKDQRQHRSQQEKCRPRRCGHPGQGRANEDQRQHLATQRHAGQPSEAGHRNGRVDRAEHRTDGDTDHPARHRGQQRRGRNVTALDRDPAEKHVPAIRRASGHGEREPRQGHRSLRSVEDVAGQRDSDDHHGCGQQKRRTQPATSSQRRQRRCDEDVDVGRQRPDANADQRHRMRPTAEVDSEDRAAGQVHDRGSGRQLPVPSHFDGGEDAEHRHRKRTSKKHRGCGVLAAGDEEHAAERQQCGTRDELCDGRARRSHRSTLPSWTIKDKRPLLPSID
jgi:hypothetical protein